MKAVKLMCAGLFLLLQACTPQGADDDAGAAATLELSVEQRSRLQVVAVRVQQAEDLRAIKRLEHTLAQYLSAGRWRDAAGLFASEARVTYDQTTYVGSEQIAARLQQLTGALPGQGLVEGRLFENVLLSPVVNVMGNGESALGRWRSISMAGDWGHAAAWHVAIRENRYVREDGQWKILELRHYPVFSGDYEEGWRNVKEEAPGTVQPVPFHYDMERAGMPAPPVTTAQAAGVEVGNPLRFLASLEQRAQRLADEDAIINLQNAFGYYMDRKMWDDVVDLFQPDGSFEFAQAGVYRGHAGIRRGLEQFGPPEPPVDHVFDHIHLQPVVTIAADGLRARLRGTEIQMLGRHQDASWFGINVHLNDFVKRDGVWQIDKVHAFTRVFTDYDHGWALDVQAPRLARNGYPPDAPPSVRYAAWPASYVPPFAERGVIERNTTPSAVDADEFDARLAALENDVHRLLAYNGIENVSNAYGYAIDEFLWDDMADLFAVNGWKELSNVGRYTGRERIRQSVVDRYGRGGRRPNSMTFHQKTQPYVTVSKDGNSASIRTRLYQLNSSLQNPGSYMSGIYENTAVLENGIWKLSSMDLDYTWQANYKGGWSAVVVREGGGVQLPTVFEGEGAPDAPLRGRVTPGYPTEPPDMAFHFDNPISGREPPIRLREREMQHGL